MAQPANGSPDETWTGWTARPTGEPVPAVAVAGARTSAAVARAARQRVGVFMAVPPDEPGVPPGTPPSGPRSRPPRGPEAVALASVRISLDPAQCAEPARKCTRQK